MKDLIERLEALTGPCRECDLDLWWERKANRGSANAPMPDDYRKSNLRMNDAPRYTASIDAAMTLGTDDWSRADMMVTAMSDLGNPDYMEGGKWLAMLPIRCCIAALKANP